MLGNGILLATGGGIALMLLAIGILFGIRLGRRQAGDSRSMTQSDRERILQMLQELATWTSEYSGNVSQYQSKLSELTDVAEQGSS